MVVKKQFLRVTLFSSVIFLICAACGRNDESNTENSETQANSNATPAPIGTTISTTPSPKERPSSLCGRNGFDYLLYAYFYPNCNSCHGNSDFASGDSNVGFPMITKMDNAKILNVVTAGQFCTGKCRLKTTDAMYQDVTSWLDVKSSTSCSN